MGFKLWKSWEVAPVILKIESELNKFESDFSYQIDGKKFYKGFFLNPRASLALAAFNRDSLLKGISFKRGFL